MRSGNGNKVIYRSALACFSLVLAAAAQPDFEATALKAVPIREGIFMLEGAGGNSLASIGTDGVLLVDSKFAPVADRVRDLLAQLGGGKIGYVLNTHFHGDHIGGNAFFGAEAPIIAHANVRRRLLSEPRFGQRYFPPAPADALPTLTFDSTLTLHFNGDEIKLVHFPNGHTNGDAAVFFTRANVVHLGDLFFNRLFPFVDLDYGGDVETLTRHISQLLHDLPNDVKLVPGHGPLASIDDLKTFHRMLVQTTAAVRQGMAAQKSLDQIKAAGLPKEWAAWDWAYVPARRWIEIVYWSLSKE